jgi:hypothetical protein
MACGRKVETIGAASHQSSWRVSVATVGPPSALHVVERRRESRLYGGMILFPSGTACRWNHKAISNTLNSYFSRCKWQYRH